MKAALPIAVLATSIVLVACSKSPADQRGDSTNPNSGSTAPTHSNAQIYTDEKLRESIKTVYKDGFDDAFRETKAFLAYTDDAKAFKEERIVKLLAVLTSIASKSPVNPELTIASITPPTKEPEATIVVDKAYLESQKGATTGSFQAGGMSGEYIGLLRHPSGLLSKSLRVARGLYYSEASPTPTQNMKAFVTVLSVTTSPKGLAVTGGDDPMSEVASRKHLFQSVLPDECLIFDNKRQIQFPIGAGSRYRFIGASAECFDGLVFFGSDSEFPLTFMLLPDRGLTYIHGKGAVYKNGTKIATFPAKP